jgi:ELWxxDGT repeat protein
VVARVLRASFPSLLPRVQRPAPCVSVRLCLEELEPLCLLSATPFRVSDIQPGAHGSYPVNLTNVNNLLFFTANDGAHGIELWESNGTAAGTHMVKDINPGSAGSFPSELTNVNGTLFFTANDGSGYDLWKSDGTAAGTVPVAGPGTPNTLYGPTNLTNVSGTLFFTAGEFSANFGGYDNQLWKSDGTTVTRLTNGTNGYSGPQNLTNVNGTLFFTSNVSDYPYTGLYESTPTGTFRVPGAGTDPQNLTNVAGTLYFTAFNGGYTISLFRSDGTAAGTNVVTNLYHPGSFGGQIGHFTAVGSELFFTDYPGPATGITLFKSDGTTAGTVFVQNFPATVDDYPGPFDLTNVNGTLFFIASDGNLHGDELWKSDGTTAGTTMVADIFPGSRSSYPITLTNVNGVLYFVANDGSHGYELWKSDGTSAGTMLVQDINPGSGNGLETTGFPMAVANDFLFFSANDGSSGFELWALGLDNIAPTSTTGIPTNGSTFAPGTFTGIIQGTATDNTGGSGVASVELSISDGKGDYFNGTTFVPSTTPIFNPTTLNADGTWSFTLPPAALTPGTTYSIQSQAVDNQGNVEQAATITFTVTMPATPPIQPPPTPVTPPTPPTPTPPTPSGNQPTPPPSSPVSPPTPAPAENTTPTPASLPTVPSVVPTLPTIPIPLPFSPTVLASGVPDVLDLTFTTPTTLTSNLLPPPSALAILSAQLTAGVGGGESPDTQTRAAPLVLPLDLKSAGAPSYTPTQEVSSSLRPFAESGREQPSLIVGVSGGSGAETQEAPGFLERSALLNSSLGQSDDNALLFEQLASPKPPMPPAPEPDTPPPPDGPKAARSGRGWWWEAMALSCAVVGLPASLAVTTVSARRAAQRKLTGLPRR